MDTSHVFDRGQFQMWCTELPKRPRVALWWAAGRALNLDIPLTNDDMDRIAVWRPSFTVGSDHQPTTDSIH